MARPTRGARQPAGRWLSLPGVALLLALAAAPLTEYTEAATYDGPFGVKLDRVTWSDKFIANQNSRVRDSLTSTPCRCDGGKAVDCEEASSQTRAAVEMVCPIKQSIQDVRHTRACRISQISGMGGHTVAVQSGYNAGDIARSRLKDCKDDASLLGITDDKAQQSKMYMAHYDMDTVELLAAVAAAEAIRPYLYQLREGKHPLFHTANDTAQSLSTYHHLPEEQPVRQHRSCAVVGNSGYLNAQKMGKDIDGHDEVLRINQGAVSPKYLRAAGSKTTSRLLSANAMKPWSMESKRCPRCSFQDMGKTGDLIAVHPDQHLLGNLNKRVSARNGARGSKLELHVAHEDALGLIKRVLIGFRAGLEEAQGVRYRGGVNPSAGLVGVMMMMNMCQNVTAYGFTLQNCQGSCPPQLNHYFQGRRDGVYRTDVDRMAHQLDVEGFLLKALHVLGEVCIEPKPKHLGPCGGRFSDLLGVGKADAVLEGTRAWNVQRILDSPRLKDQLLSGWTAPLTHRLPWKVQNSMSAKQKADFRLRMQALRAPLGKAHELR